MELGRRPKRSLDGNISYRKSAVITLIVLGEQQFFVDEICIKIMF